MGGGDARWGERRIIGVEVLGGCSQLSLFRWHPGKEKRAVEGLRHSPIKNSSQ